MKIRFIPAGVTLIAGAITCLICLMRNYDVMYSLEMLLLVLIIFSLIGMKAQQVILNVMREQKMQEEEEIRMAEWKEAERLKQMEAQQDMQEEQSDDEREEEEESKQ